MRGDKVMKQRWKYLISAMMVVLFLSSTTVYGGQRPSAELIARQNTSGSGSGVWAQSRHPGLAMDAPTGTDGGGPAIPPAV